MSIFPTKILLASDGSKEARLTAQAAAELSKDTGSEVHIAYVLPSPTELRGHHLYSREVMRSVLEQAEGEARSSRSKPSSLGRPEGRWPIHTSGRESRIRRS
jgi:nucleotide-binding universal stress UspA family protein